jgi:hypothetical protein
MKYPCIPVWMKNREKDPFDYPLRSKKELAFEQFMLPPMFCAKLIINDYQVISQNKTYSAHKADNRNNIAKIELNLDEMGLSPLQEKRLIFLLGPRYKQGSRRFKIVCRQYTKYEHNIARVMDIFRQLYWEAKRAPIYYLPIMKNRERRRFRDRILGKKLTPEQLEETLQEGKAEFDQLWDSGTYGKEHLMKRMEPILKNHFKKLENKADTDEGQLSADKAEEMLRRENIEKELVKKKVLTQKAYETFYGKDAIEENTSDISSDNKTQ